MVFCPPAWGSGNPDQLLDNGKRLYGQYCAHCHGTQGNGDGYNLDYLEKEPAELSSKVFISKKSNDQIFRVIQKGGVGVRKSHLMPAFGKTLSEKEIWSLVAWIRHLAKDDTQLTKLPDGVGSERPLSAGITDAEMAEFRDWFVRSGALEEPVESGKNLFTKKKSCLACHQVGDQGGIVGPSLSRAGFNYTSEWVYAWIRNPQSYNPDSKMPNMDLTPEEARFIAAFLNSRHVENEAIPDEWKGYLQLQGNPERGKKLFFDLNGKATCAKCHTINGEGGHIGPNLSFIGSRRTVPFLIESIMDPKAVITAGYSTVLILTKARKFITGIKQNEDDSGIELIDKEGKGLRVPKEQIKKFKTQDISMMPGNFKDILTPQEIADCLAFLTSLKLTTLSSAHP